MDTARGSRTLSYALPSLHNATDFYPSPSTTRYRRSVDFPRRPVRSGGGGRETEGGSYIFLLLFHFRDERRGGEENKKIKHTTFSCHQRRVLVFDFVSTPLPSTHFSARTVGIRFGFPHHETNKNRRYSTTPSVPGKHSSLPGKLVIVAGRRRVTEEILAKRVENRESYTKSAFGSVSEFENNTTKVFTRYRTRLPLKTHRNTALRSPREYECA